MTVFYVRQSRGVKDNLSYHMFKSFLDFFREKPLKKLNKIKIKLFFFIELRVVSLGKV